MLYHAWQNHRLYRRGGLAGRQYVLLSYNHQQSERTNIWKKIYLIYFKISVVIFIQRVEQVVKYTNARAQHVHHLHRSLPRSDNGMLYISLSFNMK